MSIIVTIVAIGFAVMGVAALVKPAVIWAPFGVTPTTPGSRSEVRAVYGGFGIALAVLLFVADGWSTDLRAGVVITAAVALAGMAVGRAISALVEPKALLGYPGFFLVLEAVFASLLYSAR